MTNQAEAPDDLATQALGRLVRVLSEDAVFALAAGGTDPAGNLEGLARRRSETYNAVLQGTKVPSMKEQFEPWLVSVTRAMAGVFPPVWMPMMDVVRERISLEVSPRGIRGLFSSKPSEKDIARVRRFAPLAVRMLRAVFAADGQLDVEERIMVNAFISGLGLPDAEAAALRDEAPIAPERFDMYLDIEPGLAQALVRGAWLAAAWDIVDPREEQVVRVLSHNIGLPAEHVEEERQEAEQRVNARRTAGLAVVDGLRYLLADRVPGIGITIPAVVGSLVLPRRYRDEALAHIGHGIPVTLAKRYTNMPGEDRVMVAAIAWACALGEDPTTSRAALLKSRWERFAADVGEESARARSLVDDWLLHTLGTVAKAMK